MAGSAGPNITNDGLVFALDAANFKSISGVGNELFNNAPQLAKNLTDRSQSITSNNGVHIGNLTYYTGFGISYPEGNYGGDGANRNGLTPGLNVRSGGKTYEASRSLHLWVWNNQTNSWIEGYFTGARLSGHCYDNYGGAENGWDNEMAKFATNYTTIRNTFPDCTYIVLGSHACQCFRQEDVDILISLGAPSGTVSSWTANNAWREFVLVGRPGLGSGNAYGWAFENYNTDPGAVAHLNFGLPVYGNKDNYFTFDGSNDYITIPPSIVPTSHITIELVYRNDDSGRNTSVIAGGASAQDLNILPWSDTNVYWDCGRPFNRIYKATTSGERTGIHHWVFTKDPTTGIMNIYLDGALWHTGSGLTSTLPALTTVSLGCYDSGNSRGYYTAGIIPVAKIYNRALTAAEVKQNFQGIRKRFGL